MSIVDVVELLDVLEEVVGHCGPNEHRVPQASPAANQAKPTRPTFCALGAQRAEVQELSKKLSLYT